MHPAGRRGESSKRGDFGCILIEGGKENMKRTMVAVIAALCVLFTASASHALFTLGAGIHYLKTVGDIKDAPAFDSNAYNLVASAQMSLLMFKIEADVEWVPDYGGSDESLLMPQALVLFGGMIYGGAGIGSGYIDGEWFDKPFYSLRLGVDIPLGPVGVDINANYRFMDTKVFESADEEDLDSVTFGAIVRFKL